MRVANNAIVIQEGKILLVKKRETWILPGGKPQFKPHSNEIETDIECIVRETGEELNGTELEDFVFYNEIIGTTPHTGDILKARTYFAKIRGELRGVSQEIKAAEFTNKPHDYNLSDITSKIVDVLITDGYLK